MKRWSILGGLICSVVLSAQVAGVFTYDKSTVGQTAVPVGTEKMNMLTFKVGTGPTGPAEDLKRVVLQNTGSNVYFGNGIKSVTIYLDSNNDETFSPDIDTVIKGIQTFGTTPVNPSNKDITIEFPTAETVSSSNQKIFFVVYDVDKNAQLAATTNVVLKQLSRDGSALDLTTINSLDKPTSHQVNISGVKIFATDVSPSVVLPGQNKIPMSYFQVQLSGENITDPSPITMKGQNDQNNFISEVGSTNGVSKAYLYRTFASSNAIDPDNDTLIKVISDFGSSTSQVTFSNLYDLSSLFNGIVDGAPANFYIAYDIGDSLSVTQNSEVSSQIFEFSGTGNNSKLNITWPLDENDRPEASTAFVAGMSLEDINSIIPASTFGPQTIVPMLSFRLRANHTNVVVNQITILNTGSVPFITDPSGTNGVRQIELFVDSDNDANFSETSDLRIGNVTLGSVGANNQANSVAVPIVVESTPVQNGLNISQFDSAAIGYPTNNDKVIFVRYTFGEQTNSTTLEAAASNAQLGTLQATATVVNSGVSTQKVIGLSGIDSNNPAAATPNAEVALVDTNLMVSNVTSIAPGNALQGQLKVPMLSIDLNIEQSFVSTNIQISNSTNTFLSDGSGVSKVWLYEDVSNFGVLDDTDVLLGSTSKFDQSLQTVNIGAVPLAAGQRKLMVLYDIGQNATITTGRIRAQLQNIIGSDDEELLLGGQLPQPDNAASLTIVAKRLNPTTLSLDSTNFLSTVNVNIQVQNTSGSSIKISNVYPKVYLTDISGIDISYEFSSKIDESISFPLTLANGASQTFSFDMKHMDRSSGGSAYVDSYVVYQVTDSAEALVSRYQGKIEWNAGSTNPTLITLESNRKNYNWLWPSYIESITLKRGTKTVDFANYIAIREGDIMTIKFKNNGEFLDESSINLQVNGVVFTQSSSGADNTYRYDSNTGSIVINKLGTADGILTISATDLGNHDLEVTELQFQISDKMLITNALFFPSPFALGQNDLELGFSLTRPGDVTFYFYNQLGELVFEETKTFTEIGYNVHTIPATAPFLSPGLFLCRLSAIDSNGSESSIITKLAVY